MTQNILFRLTNITIQIRENMHLTCNMIASKVLKVIKHIVCAVWLLTMDETSTQDMCVTSTMMALRHHPLIPLYPSQLTCSLTFCFCGVEQGGRHSYSGRSRRPGRWVICKICNTTLFTILSILPFSLTLLSIVGFSADPKQGSPG